jgi:phenylacetate-CoA ligase
MSIAAQLQCPFALKVAYPPDYVARCRAALEEALDHTPAYAAWQPYDPGPTFDVFTRLAALPALTKRELRAFGPQGFVPHGRDMTAALAAGEIELVSTSGTTSDQVTNIWYQPWWNASESASWQINARARAVATGAHREAILTSPFCTGFPCEDGLLRREERTLGRFLYLSERSDPSTWPESLMDRMVEEINAYRPVLLEANPSFLARLARHIVHQKLRVQSPALIVLTYEYPSVLHYRQIRRAFDAPIASSYGATEAGYVFMECEQGRLHQVSANGHVDFLPLAPEHGGPDVGCILVTPFDNPWRALLRFDIGDLVRLAPEACPCGRHDGLTLASVEGRTVNVTRTPEGRAVTQGELDRALSMVEGLAAYQWLQTSRAAYRLRFVAEGTAPRRVANAAREILRALYGASADIALDPVETLAPDPPGKYRLAKALEPVDAAVLLDACYAPRRG